MPTDPFGVPKKKDRPVQDWSYAEAGPYSLGRAFAEMFKAMVDGGMSRREALILMQTYAEAMASAAARQD